MGGFPRPTRRILNHKGDLPGPLSAYYAIEPATNVEEEGELTTSPIINATFVLSHFLLPYQTTLELPPRTWLAVPLSK
jgi:hypothetical protein